MPPLEALIWLIALVGLAIYEPTSGDHVSFCILNNLGFTFCPGCGIGRSISHVLNGDFQASMAMHPMGILALPILLFRIVTLLINHYKIFNYGQSNRTPS